MLFSFITVTTAIVSFIIPSKIPSLKLYKYVFKDNLCPRELLIEEHSSQSLSAQTAPALLAFFTPASKFSPDF